MTTTEEIVFKTSINSNKNLQTNKQTKQEKMSTNQPAPRQNEKGSDPQVSLVFYMCGQPKNSQQWLTNYNKCCNDIAATGQMVSKEHH